jgi:hypothetical protein
MWWQTRNERASNILGVLGRLQETLFPKYPFVYGIGSTINSVGVRVPLLIMQDLSEWASRFLGWRMRPGDVYRHLPRERHWPEYVYDSLVARIGHRRRPLHSEYEGFLLPIWALQSIFDIGPYLFGGDFLREEIPANTLVLFSPPLLPAGGGPSMNPEKSSDNSLREGAQIWAENRNATLGFPFRVDEEIRFTTAGHLSHGMLTDVYALRRRFLRRPAKKLVGRLTSAVDPAFRIVPSNGVDAAVVDPHVNREEDGFRELAIADPDSVQDRSTVVLNGAKSGRQRGWVLGPMNVSRTVDGTTWTNCWTVVEMDRGFAQPGDSGGPVLTTVGSALGHLVCVLGTRHSNGRFQIGLVQDIHTLVDYIATVSGQSSPTILESIP